MPFPRRQESLRLVRLAPHKPPTTAKIAKIAKIATPAIPRANSLSISCANPAVSLLTHVKTS